MVVILNHKVLGWSIMQQEFMDACEFVCVCGGVHVYECKPCKLMFLKRYKPKCLGCGIMGEFYSCLPVLYFFSKIIMLIHVIKNKQVKKKNKKA